MATTVTIGKMEAELTAKIKPFTDSLNKAKQQATKSTATINNTLGKVSASLAKIASAYIGVKALTNFTKTAINTASNLQEVQNVVDTAFDGMTERVEIFSKTAINKFGMSELSAKKASSQFMSMSRSIGLTNDVSEEMSINIAALSNDMASFFNVEQDLAQIALKSIWSGETETLKQYGIMMQQANLQQFAYRQGINKNIASMTQQELVTLRYMYVMNNLSFVQGDFLKTQASWANQTRILSQRWMELLSIIGNGLMKVLAPLVQIMNLIISKIIVFARAISSIFSANTIVDSNKETNKSIGANVNAQNAFTDALKKSDEQAKKNKKTLMGFDEINNINTQQASGSTNSSTGDKGFDIGGFGYNDLFDDSSLGQVEENVNSMKDKLLNVFNIIKKSLEPLFNFIQKNAVALLSLLGSALAFKGVMMLPSVLSSIGPLFANLLSPIGTFVKYISTVVSLVSSGGLSALGAIFAGINLPLVAIAGAIALVVGGFIYLYSTSEKFRTMVNDLVSNTLEKCKVALDNLATILKNLWDKWIKPIIDDTMVALNVLWLVIEPMIISATEFIFGIIDLILNLWNNTLAPLINWFIDVMEPVIRVVWDSILVAITVVVGAISGVIAVLLSIFNGIIEFLNGIFSQSWSDIWNGLCEVFKGIVNSIIGIFEGMINFIVRGLNVFIDGLNWIPEKLSKVPGFGWAGDFRISHFNEVSLPRLAKGGLAFGPTLAMIGDNKNASSDPEVVAPLSKLQSMMGYSNGEMLTLLSAINDNLTELKKQGMIVELDGEVISEKVNEYNDERNRLGGTSPFALGR